MLVNMPCKDDILENLLHLNSIPLTLKPHKNNILILFSRKQDRRNTT